MTLNLLVQSIPLLMVGIVSILIMIWLWIRRSIPGSLPFILTAFAHAMLCAGSVLLMSPFSMQVATAGAVLAATGMLILPGSALAFAIEYIHLRRRLNLRQWLLVMGEGLIGMLVLYTDPLHHLVNLRVVQQSGAWKMLFNFPAMLHLVMAYAILLGTAFLIVRGFAASPRYRAQLAVLLVGLLVPWGANLLDRLGILPFDGVALTPLAFMVTQLVFAWGVINYNLLNVPPVTRSSLIDSLTDAIIVLDMHNRIIDANPAALKVVGCLPDKPIGQSVDDVLPGQCRFIFDNIGETDQREQEITLGEGADQRIHDMRVFPLLDSAESVIGRVLALRDITHIRALQEAVRSSEDKYRNLIENASDGVLILQDGFLRYLNMQLAAMLGYDVVDLVETRAHDHFFPEYHDGLNLLYGRVMEGKSISNWAAEMINRNGNSLAVELNASVMEYEGRPALLAFVRDITDRQRFERELENSLALLRSTLESSADGLLVLDLNLRVVTFNHRLLRMWNLPENWQEAEEGPLSVFPVRVQDPSAFDGYKLGVVTQPLREATNLLNMLDGRVFEWHIAPHRIGDHIAGRVWSFRDVTDRVKAGKDLQAANERLMSTVQSLESHNREMTQLSEMSDLLHSCATPAEAYSVVAEFSRRLFPGHTGALYIINDSRNLVESVAVWGPEGFRPADFSPDLCWGLRRGRAHRVQDSSVDLNCHHFEENDKPPESYICIPLIAQSETMGVYHLRSLASQVDAGWEPLASTVSDNIAMSLANIRLRETLRLQSIRDPLTGLYNRRYMEEAFELELRRATRYDRHLGLIMMDLDNFKQFNDTYGHRAGDLLLKELGKYLLSHKRGDDIACRYGGEEFLLILPETSLENTIERAEQLREEISRLTVDLRGKHLGFTISVGVAAYPEHGISMETLINAADEALYQAKRQGRNCVVAAD